MTAPSRSSTQPSCWTHVDRGLEHELGRVRHEYNSVRLHAGIGYVTPNDEHEGRGASIREARRRGLERARQEWLAYHRRDTTNTGEPGQ